MNSLRNVIHYPLGVVFCLLLTLIGCGKKSIDTNNSVSNSGFNNVQAGSSQDFTVNVGDRIFFSLDSSSIESDAEYILARQAEWLLRYPHYFITIEGHADERGTREYNLALGQRRAVAVRDYLISLGVSSQRMNTVSYGKERPVAICDNISCWNQNRRAVLVVNNTRSH
ncbi:peptidoglycan-associated lipoprotein Pal [Bartonella sp. AR 15-3]|uniref:peptidoglycan-associated lipoprotein Pal n=1 Tax=Bartonella sp. AR 15-3 TaxID=545617 RepID=UPI0001F4BA35|nr:peptidoglycan-associated lipoprotein Pal [Bartonella sp. AR 15-3]OPB32225.1 peptidoglycan-associated lipoprotein [Bartonella sp. AR 15-3]CBI79881.1 Outer membrane lipoprotein omp16 [Bartonella sp. AR 15-3]